MVVGILELPQRKLHRLKEYDYSQNGYYHVTICTRNRRNILGTVGNAVLGVPQVIPTEIGNMVIECLNKMPNVDPNIKIDCFCLMPDHIHIIVVIDRVDILEEERPAYICAGRSLQDLVHGFKSTTTRLYNKTVIENEKNTLWQLSFYDEVIRNDEALLQIREYIFNNPMKLLY